MTLVVDFSHVHRKTTGIERVSLDLFSPEKLGMCPADHVRATSSLTMLRAQWLTLPLRALLSRKDLFLCPGFPPSLPLTLLAGKRLITYVHDLFLIERYQDLNRTAKYYMRPSFSFAVRHGKHFLVNSRFTEAELRKYCAPDAVIRLARPPVANAFGLSPSSAIKSNDGPLRLICIGTVEPRKNFLYAAQIRKRLTKIIDRAVELHIIGRAGWGVDAQALAAEENVILHGYCTSDEARTLISRADLFLSTSRDEGLGLPLLEVQHGGVCVVATDIPAYREVLGTSGCLVPLDQADEAARKIADLLAEEGWRESHKRSALTNVLAWNETAEKDRADFLKWIDEQRGDSQP